MINEFMVGEKFCRLCDYSADLLDLQSCDEKQFENVKNILRLANELHDDFEEVVKERDKYKKKLTSALIEIGKMKLEQGDKE